MSYAFSVHLYGNRGIGEHEHDILAGLLINLLQSGHVSNQKIVLIHSTFSYLNLICLRIFFPLQFLTLTCEESKALFVFVIINNNQLSYQASLA